MTCDTNIKGDPKQNEEIIPLAAMKFCNSTLLATPAVPTQTSFQAANQYIFGWKNPFAFPPKDYALLHVDFLSRYDE